MRAQAEARGRGCFAVAMLVTAICWLCLGATRADAANVVYSWGLNLHGQLGDGYPNQEGEEGPEGCLFGGPQSTETVGCSATPALIGGITGVTSVAAGEEHAIALVEGGTMLAWGDNEYGQLGDGISGQEQTETGTPAQVAKLNPGFTGGVKAIAAGSEHSAAIWTFGVVYSWGNNELDQLGDGTTGQAQPESETPVQVYKLVGATRLAAGGFHTLALLENGTISAWGDDEFGQLGNNSTKNKEKPVTVKEAGGNTLTGVTAVAAGEDDSLALLTSGKVMAWGDDESGQLGDGRETTRKKIATPVLNLANVRAIASGAEHSLALLNDGTVMAWGNNEYGQLGNGATKNSTTPVHVQGLTQVTAIAAGGNHSVALTEDGTVFTWGENEYGQLGNGTSTSPECGSPSEICSAIPIEVPGLTNIQGVAAGLQDTFAYGPQAPPQ